MADSKELEAELNFEMGNAFTGGEKYAHAEAERIKSSPERRRGPREKDERRSSNPGKADPEKVKKINEGQKQATPESANPRNGTSRPRNPSQEHSHDFIGPAEFAPGGPGIGAVIN